MRATVHPGGMREASLRVPGDKSIAHRWLILAATAHGRSRLRGLPASLDVRATASCLARLARSNVRAALESWGSASTPQPEADRSTANEPRTRGRDLMLEAEGRAALEAPAGPLDCANSGTTMRLLSGVVAAAPFETVLLGDASLARRPMERVAEPLRSMGAEVRTSDGHGPITIRGARLHGIAHRTPVPSAQVKGAVLLAGLAAEGETAVLEAVQTRDHTERALRHLGAPVEIAEGRVAVRAHQHGGLDAEVPGDVSSAAFLVAAAALAGSALTLHDVGANPSRAQVLAVLERMGVRSHVEVTREELGEPVGALTIEPCDGLVGTIVERAELPLVIDEVPVLALAAAHAQGPSRFAGAGELGVKESDRLHGLVEAIRALGGEAGLDGDDLVVGGGGLEGGTADAHGDHRIAMALAVAGVAGRVRTTVEGIEAADVSYPGFLPALGELGARIEVTS